MNLPMEVLLVAGVVALYLQDAALLLHYDVVAMVRGRRWRATTGSALEFRGRRLFLPDPLRPADAMFRVTWLGNGEDPAREHWAGLGHFIAALSALKPACWLLWALQLLVLPALLWRFAHPLALLALAALIYGSCLVVAMQLWRYRRAYELDSRQALTMGFELLCCPPHAINVVRRLSLRRGLHGNAMDVARHLLDEDEVAGIGTRIGQRLDYAMDFAGDGAPLEQRLLDAKQRLETLK